MKKDIPGGPASTNDDDGESIQESASQGDVLQRDSVRPGIQSNDKKR